MKKKNNYFAMLSELAKCSGRAALFLNEALRQFEVEKLSEQIDVLHKVEHEADEKQHDLVNRLTAEFITPIEREDILTLAHRIDDVTDDVEDILIHIYMFHIDAIIPQALAFSSLIVQCCEMMQKAVDEFSRYQKSTSLREYLIEINNLESEGDRLYTEAMRALYSDKSDPVKIMAWTRTFSCFEKCCDACESVSSVIESAVMNNS